MPANGRGAMLAESRGSRAAIAMSPSLVVVLLCALAAPAALACVICAPSSSLTPAQQMINAQRVVVAKPDGDKWKPVDTLKGPAGPIPAGAVPAPANPPPGPKAVVFVEDGLSGKWEVVGAVAAEHGEWLRKVAAQKRTADMNDADWRERVAFHVPMLEHPEPLIAAIAYGEIARAPYPAMRTLQGRLDAKTLIGWLDDPSRASRKPLYTLLLGIAGGADANAWIGAQLAQAAKANDASNLAALLTADMELNGIARVGALETTYFGKPGERSPGEVQATLMALSVQGGTDARIPRRRVVNAYLVFARSGHPLAGYAAPDLTSWQIWEAASTYMNLLRSGVPQHPSSQVAILNFLAASPRADAKAFHAQYTKAQRQGSAAQPPSR